MKKKKRKKKKKKKKKVKKKKIDPLNVTQTRLTSISKLNKKQFIQHMKSMKLIKIKDISELDGHRKEVLDKKVCSDKCTFNRYLKNFPKEKNGGLCWCKLNDITINTQGRKFTFYPPDFAKRPQPRIEVKIHV